MIFAFVRSPEMECFWAECHKRVTIFRGTMIRWAPSVGDAS